MGTRKAPGELGKITFDVRPSGQVRGRARIRDGQGHPVALVAHAATEAEVRADIEAQARRVWGGLLLDETSVETIGQLTELWISHLETQVASGRITPQTRQAYIERWQGADATKRPLSTSARGTTLAERLGAVPIGRFDARLVNQVCDAVETSQSAAAATRAKRILSLIGKRGVSLGILPANPVRDSERLMRPRAGEFRSLTPEQVTVLVRLVSNWRGANPERRGGARPNAQLLLDAIVLMLGTSARPGEVLAWRREDVGYANGRMTLRVAGTIVTVRGEGTYRQPHPKGAGQVRTLTVPAWAEPTCRRLLRDYSDNPAGLLMATRAGTPYAVRYLEKLLRTFREQHETELRAIGITPDQLVPRAFRKTVATVVTDAIGIEAAQGQLGHSDPRITAMHYVERREAVPAAGADVLEARFGSIWGEQEVDA